MISKNNTPHYQQSCSFENGKASSYFTINMLFLNMVFSDAGKSHCALSLLSSLLRLYAWDGPAHVKADILFLHTVCLGLTLEARSAAFSL